MCKRSNSLCSNRSSIGSQESKSWCNQLSQCITHGALHWLQLTRCCWNCTDLCPANKSWTMVQQHTPSVPTVPSLLPECIKPLHFGEILSRYTTTECMGHAVQRKYFILWTSVRTEQLRKAGLDRQQTAFLLVQGAFSDTCQWSRTGNDKSKQFRLRAQDPKI